MAGTLENGKQDVFTITYNSVPITISKFKFALYSSKFRSIPDFITSNSLNVTGNAPFAIFSAFIKGAQGESIDIKEENVYDLLSLCEEWQTPTLNELIVQFIKQKPDYDRICEQVSKLQSDSQASADLEEIIANNLNTALNLPSFQNFSLTVLMRILNHPDIVVDQHFLFNFIMSMFSKYGPEASVLAPALDIRKLSVDEAKEFLNCPHLVSSYINESIVPITVQILEENDELRQQSTKNDEVIKSIINRLENIENNNINSDKQTEESENVKYENITKRVAELEKVVKFSNTKIENLQNQLATQNKSFKESIDETEKKAHKDVRKTNKIVNGLTRKTGSYDKSIGDMKNEQANLKRGYSNIAGVTSTLQSEIIALKMKLNILKTKDAIFGGKPFDGILQSLSNEAGQNCHLAGLVSITASSVDHSEPYQIIDYGWKDVFFTENKMNQWISIDFKNNAVKVSHYTIKTHKYRNGSPHLKMWVIEGSNDTQNWDELDRRSIAILNGPNKFQTFPCKKNNGIYHHIRLRQTGINTRNENALALTNFELFGQILTPEE